MSQAYQLWLQTDHDAMIISNNDVLMPNGVIDDLLYAMTPEGVTICQTVCSTQFLVAIECVSRAQTSFSHICRPYPVQVAIVIWFVLSPQGEGRVRGARLKGLRNYTVRAQRQSLGSITPSTTSVFK